MQYISQITMPGAILKKGSDVTMYELLASTADPAYDARSVSFATSSQLVCVL